MNRNFITFLDTTNTEHTVPVELHNIDLVKRWQNLILKNQSLGDKELRSFFINYTYKDIATIQSKINNIITIINAEYDKQLPTYHDVNTLNETVLNHLHEEFEIYGSRIDSLILENTYSQLVHDNFLLLNELIHSCEEVIHSNTMNHTLPPPMSVLFDYYPQTEFETLLERDKLHLTSEFKWGGIYLGYNTLGKDWLKVCADNDLEVIERDMVKPQVRFAAETWVNFGPDDSDNSNANKFINWYYSLTPELQNKVPIDNLNLLAFGRYKIGKVVIDESYFLKYHPSTSDWLSYNHPIKKKWNEEVFSTFREIVTIG